MLEGKSQVYCSLNHDKLIHEFDSIFQTKEEIGEELMKFFDEKHHIQIKVTKVSEQIPSKENVKKYFVDYHVEVNLKSF
jgi:hypothetical protein